jgi:predicted TIM-barrel fold metal-dependent hydrolase
MKIIDTHQHLWDLDKFTYSWTKGTATLNRSFRLSDYREATKGLDIHKTVFLECDVDEQFQADEAKYICSLAEKKENKIAGVVASARPEKPGFDAYLEKISHPNLKGIRRILHVIPDDTIEKPGFIDNINKLAKYHLSFDICVLARQLPIALRLIKECPGVQFVLDHCGNPRIKEKEFSPWQDRIAEIASYPNVVGKISGIVTNAEPNKWTPADLKPYVDHMIKSFGWERVMFGSDWPVVLLNSTYKRWAEALILLTRDAGAEKQQKLFQTNAERIYRLS